jgi:glycosidase
MMNTDPMRTLAGLQSLRHLCLRLCRHFCRHLLAALLLPCLPLMPTMNAHAAPADASPLRVEPPSWWVGMHEPTLQLMVHGAGIGTTEVTLKPTPGIRLRGVERVQNPNYLFINLEIGAGARPGNLPLEFVKGGQLVARHDYPLAAREAGSAQRLGFGPKDAIYLLVPDRFAKGNDPATVQPEGMKEGEHRGDPGGRHGGNLAGMTQHLGYIADMGYTMVWPTPLIENNNEKWSYHGYAASDFYRIDPRFGSNRQYRDWVAQARARGLGVIQDIVLNHIGGAHWWMKDLPEPDWLNTWPAYTETNHARLTLQDPYAAPSDRKRFSDGWFTHDMPDLNQRNPRLANYLIQASLWWVEYAGLSGIRTDTYSYSDPAFLSRWSSRVMQEYPRLNIVGEEWSPHPAVVAYWQRGKKNHDGYQSHAPSMMDFPLFGAMLASLQEKDGWDSGFTKLYEMQAHDFLYPAPEQLVLFEANHDTARLYPMLHHDPALVKMAFAFMATTRRIPQFFYGDEILMDSPRHRDDGVVRADFPGGWEGDAVNAFTGQGLRPEQADMQAFVKKLLNWRKTAKVVHHGKMMQYSPRDGVYVLIRYDDREAVMLVLNKNAQAGTLDLSLYPDLIPGPIDATEVISGAPARGTRLPLAPRSAALWQFSR